MIEAIQAILKAAQSAGIKAYLHCGTPAYATRTIEWGLNLTTLNNDVRLLAGAAVANVTEFRSLLVEKQLIEKQIVSCADRGTY